MYRNFEELLKLKNTTIYQVSKAAGIPESTLYMWKRRSQINPNAGLAVETLVRVADALEVSIEELI